MMAATANLRRVPRREAAGALAAAAGFALDAPAAAGLEPRPKLFNIFVGGDCLRAREMARDNPKNNETGGRSARGSGRPSADLF